MSKKKLAIANETTKDNEHDHQWTVAYLLTQFRNESDRAAVILAASLIDDALTSLLRTHLAPCSNGTDPLFDSATSPLSNFSSKIDMLNRLGLISAHLTRDIHLIRKIRNSFAHDIFGCDFQNGSVKNRVRELLQSVALANNAIKYVEKERVADHLKGTRGNFLACSSLILFYLNDSIKNIKQISELPSEAFLYKIEK